MLIMLVWNWPYTQTAVTSALQDRFARTVQIRSFRKTYFPPGCVAEGVSFLHRHRKDLPPLITVQTLVIRGSYNGLLRIHKRVDEVQVNGLHVLIPPPGPSGQPPSVLPLTTSTSGTPSVTIGVISTDGAVLEFMPRQREQETFKLLVHRLTLDKVAENGSSPFHAALLNTEPPGEIRTDGEIGPWNIVRSTGYRVLHRPVELAGLLGTWLNRLVAVPSGFGIKVQIRSFPVEMFYALRHEDSKARNANQAQRPSDIHVLQLRQGIQLECRRGRR
jgi:hypothetical protein